MAGQLLATDENNTEFQGARDPDSLLHVRFYERAVQNNFKTEQEGRPIFDSMVFIEIHTPGNQLNVIDRPKMRSDEFRFSKQWALYATTHSDDPAKQGTPLSQWPMLNLAMAETLRYMKFFTVEQIAGASDQQLQSIGMTAGMAPLALRAKAKAYLEVAHNMSVVATREQEIAQRDSKIKEMEERHTADMKAMQDKMDAILSNLSASKKTKRKYIMTAEHKAKMKQAREAKHATNA